MQPEPPYPSLGGYLWAPMPILRKLLKIPPAPGLRWFSVEYSYGPFPPGGGNPSSYLLPGARPPGVLELPFFCFLRLLSCCWERRGLKNDFPFRGDFSFFFCPTCVNFFGYWLNFDAKMLSYLNWIFSSILLSNFDPLDSEIYCFS